MGSGFSLDAINVIRGNRALLKRRNFKDIKALLLEASGKTELEFKKVSPAEMAKIKASIREQRQKDIRREIIIYIISAAITIGIFYALYHSLT